MRFAIDPDRLPSGVRILGDGYVGGKAVGLIFAASAVEFDHAVLSAHQDLLAFPESVIVATGYFDEFMRHNRLDDAVQQKCDGRISKQDLARRFMEAPLPKKLASELGSFLGRERRPLAVRSSSFLEDNLKHSFAGIYQSLFIPNNGPDRARLEQLLTAVRLVYLSTFGDNAREYRLKHNIKWRSEKMGVLIQNLIGREHPDRLFYPLIAGVGFSKNFYPWAPDIRTEGGVARVVMGLGTKAVGRSFARVFSPSNPRIRPEGGSMEDILKYSQQEIDALDMVTGGVTSPRIDDIKLHNDQIGLIMSELREESYLMDAPRRIEPQTRLVPTFDRMLDGKDYPLVGILADVLGKLEELMEVPVDLEFAVNIGGDDRFYILQARPLGGRAEHGAVKIPQATGGRRVILKSQSVLGNGMKLGLRHIVYMPLDMYRFDRGHAIARQVGELNGSFEGEGYILIGPGRWATSHPDLGVPVTYAEISNAQVIVECSFGSFTPELSYGTHFFGDMVVSNILYIPVFQEKGDFLDKRFLETEGEAKSFEGLRVVDVEGGIDVYADGQSRRGIIMVAGGRMGRRGAGAPRGRASKGKGPGGKGCR